MSSTTDFYDLLSTDYHLIATGWDQAVQAQGQIIDRLLKEKLHLNDALDILDCTCGIGTQAFGLALRGHRVTGTDISPKSIEAAKENALRLKTNVSLETADMMDLRTFKGKFDCVISFDNAIAHLLNENDLIKAFKSMKESLRSGGTLLASLRDYDKLAKDRPSGMLPRRIKDEFGDRVYLQTWKWTPDSKFYDMNLFVLKNTGEEWKAKPIATRMRAYKQIEITSALEEAGLSDIEWYSPDVSGYYQPIVKAKAVN